MEDLMRTAKELTKIAFPTYRGRKISEDRRGSVTFCNTNWFEGSRNYYVAVELSTGRVNGLRVPAPWVNPIDGQTVPVPPGIAVVEHSYFGQSQWVTVHYPADAPALPAPALPA